MVCNVAVSDAEAAGTVTHEYLNVDLANKDKILTSSQGISGPYTPT